MRQLSDTIRSTVVAAYNDSLTPVFGYLVVLVAVAVFLLIFVQERPLSTGDSPSPAPTAADPETRPSQPERTKP